MKILFTTNTYFPLNDGISIVTRYLAEGLANKGHEVIVYTLCRGETQYETYNNVHIKRYKIYENAFKHLSGEIEEFIKDITSFDGDIVVNENIDCPLTDLTFTVCNSVQQKKILHLHGMAGYIRGVFSKQDSVFHYFGNIFHFVRGKYYYRTLPNYMKKYNRILCLSKYDESYDFVKKNSLKNVSILGNACDDAFFMDEFDDINRKYSIPDHFFLCIANYMERKNQIAILEAYMNCKCTDYSMVFIGSSTNQYYDKLIKRYSILKDNKHDVLFLTNVNRDDIASITSKARATVYYSTWEAYSISLVESLAVGVPFISSDTGNARELPGGIIVKDKNELTAYMERMITDTSYRNELGSAGKNYAIQNCRIEHKVDELERIMDLLLLN